MRRVRAENRPGLHDRNQDDKDKVHRHLIPCATTGYLLSPNHGLMVTRSLLGHGDRTRQETSRRRGLKMNMKSTDQEEG